MIHNLVAKRFQSSIRYDIVLSHEATKFSYEIRRDTAGSTTSK